MADGIDRILKLFNRLAARVTERVVILLAIVAIVSGFALAFVSVIPDISSMGSANLAGSVAAFSERNESFQTDGGLSELRLVNGSCSISVTLLNEAELAEYQASGTRPDPQLSCGQAVVTFAYPLRLIIIENSGASAAPFEVSARFLDVRYPRGLLAIPALPLAFGGSIYIVIQGFRRGLGRIQDQLANENKKEKR